MRKTSLTSKIAYGYDGRVLRISLRPMGRVDKAMDNKKTLSIAIAHTHRLLAHISTRLNNKYFSLINISKSNTYSEATTQYLFYPSATSFIEALGSKRKVSPPLQLVCDYMLNSFLPTITKF